MVALVAPMYNRDAKTTKLSSLYTVKARQTPRFSDANLHPPTVSGRLFSPTRSAFFSPFNCQILQDEGSKYGDQLPLARALPLWGGVSEGGFAVVAIHENKKMMADEFVEVVRKGKLTDAIRKLNPIKPDGPWFALCDNESFLKKAKATTETVAEQGVSLWHIPPRSPDLNPVEKCWAWLRREQRRLDLQDRSKKKRPLSKSAYAARVRSLCGSQRAQRVASNFAKGLKRVCNEVIAKKGAASSG
jgi:hypothetical protein